MYKGIALDCVDHYVRHLPYMVVESELNITREDVDPTLLVSRIIFQVGVSLYLYIAQTFH